MSHSPLIIVHSPHPIVPFCILHRSRDRRECFKQFYTFAYAHERRRMQNVTRGRGEWRIMRGECDPIYRYFLFVSHYSLHSRQWKRGIKRNCSARKSWIVRRTWFHYDNVSVCQYPMGICLNAVCKYLKVPILSTHCLSGPNCLIRTTVVVASPFLNAFVGTYNFKGAKVTSLWILAKPILFIVSPAKHSGT